jgi:GNAT superfamily N-acetyltransferase
VFASQQRPCLRYSIIDTKSELGVLRKRFGSGMPAPEQVFDLLEACYENDGHVEGVFGQISSAVTSQTIFEKSPRALNKMKIGMENSAVVVAVYDAEGVSIFENVLGQFADVGKQRLVGFGRAISDTALVATLHDIMVHPRYRNSGVGRRILNHLTRHLDTVLDVIDVGAAVPVQAQPFFCRCGFGDDDEGSTLMMLRSRSNE